MHSKNRILALLLLGVVASAAMAAAVDDTSASYKPNNGPPGSVPGMVLQISDDAYNSEPVNSTHPLPVTGTLTTTPSGTQDVNNKQVNGVTTSTGAGAVGTGSQRVSVGQDATTIAGSAPGTAGTPSTNVVSVQGVANGTSLPVTSAPAATSGVGIVVDPSASAEGSKVLKASAGNLYRLLVSNGAAAGYVMVFNATSAPADGAVTPSLCVAMPAANTSLAIDLDPTPAHFTTGITAVYSTTGCFTKTVSATAVFMGMTK